MSPKPKVPQPANKTPSTPRPIETKTTQPRGKGAVLSALSGGTAPSSISSSDFEPVVQTPQRPTKLIPGTRVRVNEGSGVDSRREGVIVPNSHAHEIDRQAPGKPSWRENPSGSQYGEPGRYTDFNPGTEVIIRGDDGKLFTMLKNRLTSIPKLDDGKPSESTSSKHIQKQAELAIHMLQTGKYHTREFDNIFEGRPKGEPEKVIGAIRQRASEDAAIRTAVARVFPDWVN